MQLIILARNNTIMGDQILEIPGREPFDETSIGTENPVVAEVENDEPANPLAEQQEVVTDSEDVTPITLAKLTNDKYKSIEDIEALEQELADLKNAPKKTGDEFIDDLHEFVKNGGDPYDYVKASKITIEGLSDLEIVKLKMKLNNDADLTDEEIDEYVRDRYNQYEDRELYGIDEKKAKLGLAQLKLDAKRDKDDIMAIRSKSMYNRKVEEKVIDPAIVESEERITRELNNAHKSYKGSELVYEDVKVKIPIADQSFLDECVKNPNAIFNAFRNNDGVVDYEKFLDVVNYISNPTNYKNTIAKTAYSKGVESQVNKITNPSEIQTEKGESMKRVLNEDEFKAQFS